MQSPFCSKGCAFLRPFTGEKLGFNPFSPLIFLGFLLFYAAAMAESIDRSAFRGKIIAIDGPAGSGKSTTARLLAQRLGFTYLDTGAMYRAVALAALDKGVSLDDAKSLADISAEAAIEFRNDPQRGQLIFLNGTDVTDAIRTPEATRGSSAVAVHPGVRREMVRRQKQMGQTGNLVAEGRDTTSVVFVDADLKIYLDADLETRAKRRYLEAKQRGEETSIEEQKRLLIARDKNDTTRRESPLTKVPDAVVVDTTDLSIEQQVDRIIDLASKAFTGRP
jgi:cytidylate kinase